MLRRLSRMQTRQLERAATRNVAKFDEESPRIRDAQARAASETLFLGAAWAPRFVAGVNLTGSPDISAS